MKTMLKRLMSPTRLLRRSASLSDATAAIQRALRPLQAPPAANDARDAVDAGDGAAPPGGHFIAGHFSNEAGARDYKLFIPPGAEGHRLPLVVMLHGCTQTPDDFAAGTGMNEAALRRGLYVLYPAQAPAANPTRCWNWFRHDHQTRGRGEPALLAGMTTEVMRRHGIDPRRVYVAGLSAGGAMAAILGDAYPDLFAAVGVHSGLPAGAARDVGSAFSAMQSGAAAAARQHDRPPTIVFHGDQDNTVHPINGERVIAQDPAASAPDVRRMPGGSGHSHTRHLYRDGAGRVKAEHWVVHGSGHAWSGGSATGSYTDAKGPSATNEMLRFFADHELAASH